MKKTIFTLLLTVSILFAASDYAYKVTDVTETSKDGVIIQVRVTMTITKGVDSTPYADYLNADQLKLYIADHNNITKICEDIAAVGKKGFDSKLSASKPVPVKYSQPALDAIVIDPVKVDQKP